MELHAEVTQYAQLVAQLGEVFGCPTADLLAKVSITSRDRTGVLNEKLAGFSEADRLLILTIIDNLAARLQD